GAMVQESEKQYIGLGAMTLAAALTCAAATALTPDHRLVGFVAAAAFSFKENVPRPQHFTAELPVFLATALGVLCAAALMKYYQSKRGLQNISSYSSQPPSPESQCSGSSLISWPVAGVTSVMAVPPESVTT